MEEPTYHTTLECIICQIGDIALRDLVINPLGAYHIPETYRIIPK